MSLSEQQWTTRSHGTVNTTLDAESRNSKSLAQLLLRTVVSVPDQQVVGRSTWKTGSRKRFYHDVVLGEFFAAQPYYVVIIIMAVDYYCMGGLEIFGDSAVLSADSRPVRGLCTGGRDDGC